MTGDRQDATDVNAVIDAHERSGYRLAVGGVETFVLDLGHGQPVVCLHGVPASSFLYRKLIVELAARGLRGIAFDLPGPGLAERPAAFDYTWTGLGRFASAAVEALDLDRFHLVVHDIGAPVRFELAAAHPGRVASLTVLNAPVEVDTFHRPWVMKPFAVKGWARRTFGCSTSRPSGGLCATKVLPTSARSRPPSSTPTSSCSAAPTTAGPS